MSSMPPAPAPAPGRVPAQTRARFLGLIRVTLVAVYLLILLGGIVRSTGAGMGCPDWPRCFGGWIPPTSVDQLLPDYQEHFLEKRQAKNERLAQMLGRLGMTELAHQVRHEEMVAQETEFNARKTWTEYINRLAGASIGLLVIAILIASFKWRKQQPRFVVWSALTLLAVIFNGWTGSLVVSTNLLPWMVTFHMLLALLVVAQLILLHHAVEQVEDESRAFDDPGPINGMLLVAMAAMVVQIAMGTQVREGVDSIALMMQNGLRETWIENLGVTFYIHRSFSLVLLLLHGGLLWMLRQRTDLMTVLQGRFRWLLALTLVEVGSGAILAYFSIPAAVQPLHLVLATLIFGFQFEIFLALNYSRSSWMPSSLRTASR